MKHTFFIFLLLLLPLPTSAQTERKMCLMEWNCENLFDTLHDYGKDDTQFLPDSEYAWNSGRYWHKLRAMARTIMDAGGLAPVDIVALCEVENDSVLHDLTRRTRMASLGYQYVIEDGPDLRGVDAALLYRPETFQLLSHATHPVSHDAEKERPTRDVLHCSGVIPNRDTLDVIVVHFPSRRGGAKHSEGYRLRAAGVVRNIVDSLHSVRLHPAIVVMGDCNDEPSDSSLRLMEQGGLTNVSAKATAVGEGLTDKQLATIRGTYYYQREWNHIDNILVADAALKRWRKTECSIFAPHYLLEQNADGDFVPYRVYLGPHYHGGVSDHLPLLLDLWY